MIFIVAVFVVRESDLYSGYWFYSSHWKLGTSIVHAIVCKAL